MQIVHPLYQNFKGKFKTIKFSPNCCQLFAIFAALKEREKKQRRIFRIQKRNQNVSRQQTSQSRSSNKQVNNSIDVNKRSD